MHFVKLFGPQDLAKQMQRYMGTNTSINTNIMYVCQGIGQMQELNKLLPDMPRLYHKKDRQPVIQIVTKYTPLEMCTHVLAAIPLKLTMVYHAGVQDNFEIDMSVLILWLEAVNLGNNQTKGMLRQYVVWEL